MKLTLTQSERHFQLSNGRAAILRVLQPSLPHGGWPGNKRVIRDWKSTWSDRAIYGKCTPEQVIELERALGEVDRISFFDHPTLGLVASESNADDPQAWPRALRGGEYLFAIGGSVPIDKSVPEEEQDTLVLMAVTTKPIDPDERKGEELNRQAYFSNAYDLGEGPGYRVIAQFGGLDAEEEARDFAASCGVMDLVIL